MSVARVLVVDDDAFARMVVATKIRELRAEVVEAADGIEAFKHLERGSFDLVIADLDMPQMNGYELLGCIRGVPRLKHLPVIVLTGHEDRAALERALTSGATSYLVKPLNWLAFHAHIMHILYLSCAARGADVDAVA